MFILPSHLFALLCAPPQNVKSLKTGTSSVRPPARATTSTEFILIVKEQYSLRPLSREAPRVTCPKRELSSSQSSNLPERTRKCPRAGVSYSGRAVSAFVPPAAGLPRCPHSQYVSPRPPGLPPPALACHALPFLAGC